MSDRATNQSEERMGQAIDAVDNLSHGLKIPMRDELHIKCLSASLPKAVTELKSAFVQLTGSNPWQEWEQ